jgi:two-component system cell cycle response regulator
LKILVADDDELSLMLMETTLKRIGYDVVAAVNGRDAMDRLLEIDGPRLALLDWMMPEMDGPVVCQNIRALSHRPYIYVTLLTSKDSKADLVEGLDAGADDYLTKPCDPEELKARLRTGQRILQLEDQLVTAREEMRFKATHDPLTTLWNRGKILETLDQTLQIGQPSAVLLCDVDHFKGINDTHGHLAGDEVLREIAHRLRRAVRQDDAIGRYGGEEFLVLLSGCDERSLLERAEQLRAKVAGTEVNIEGDSISVTVSIGAIFASGDEPQQTSEAILHRADEALYLAKQNGRNRVVTASAHMV